MGDVDRHVAALEAIGARCRSCEGRATTIRIGGPTAAEACPACGATVPPLVFTIDIDRASGREGDAA